MLYAKYGYKPKEIKRLEHVCFIWFNGLKTEIRDHDWYCSNELKKGHGLTGFRMGLEIKQVDVFKRALWFKSDKTKQE